MRSSHPSTQSQEQHKYSSLLWLVGSSTLFILFVLMLSSLLVPDKIKSEGIHSEYDNQGTHLREQNMQTWVVQNDAKETVAMELIRTENNYKITVEINRPCIDLLNKYFSGPNLDLVTKARIGPDEIMVFVEGSTLQVEVAASENFCNRYHAYFQVPLSGPHRLKVVRLRSNYMAARDLLPSYPKINYEVFLDKLIPSDFTKLIPRPCTSFSIFDHLYPLHAIHGYWMSASSELSTTPMKVAQHCDGSAMRGIPELSTYVKASIEFGSKTNCANEVNNYKWNRRICSFKKKPSIIKDNDLLAEIVDVNNPRKTDLTSQNHDFSHGKSILFVGDENMRNLADLFLREVCQYQPSEKIHFDVKSATKVQFVELSKSAAASYKKLHRNDCEEDEVKCELFDEGCTSLSVAYLGEDKCGQDMTVHFSQFNYVVMNCGQIQAASPQSTMSSYRNSISELLDAILNVKVKETTLLFWVESMAPPLRQDQMLIDSEDRRTYHRMLMYHQIVQVF